MLTQPHAMPGLSAVMPGIGHGTAVEAWPAPDWNGAACKGMAVRAGLGRACRHTVWRGRASYGSARRVRAVQARRVLAWHEPVTAGPGGHGMAGRAEAGYGLARSDMARAPGGGLRPALILALDMARRCRPVKVKRRSCEDRRFGEGENDAQASSSPAPDYGSLAGDRQPHHRLVAGREPGSMPGSFPPEVRDPHHQGQDRPLISEDGQPVLGRVGLPRRRRA